MRIDLNADVGEGCGQDAELMRCITSANVACGVHAGDSAVMRDTVQLAREHRVAVGAHPGFADRGDYRAIGRVIAPWGRRIGDLRFETEGAWKRSGTTVESLARELKLALEYPEGAGV